MHDTIPIKHLLNETQTIVKSYDRVSEATGENFNIFSILQAETAEATTHSRFIGELLSPSGSHGQGEIFLSLFLKMFCPDYEFDAQNSFVVVEYHLGRVEEENGGRLDILIRDGWGKRAIMIENKIYASEQYNQLLRYRNAIPEGKLLFLTLHGTESNGNSDVEYTTLAYETDMIQWLEACKKEAINIPLLRESLTQYVNLVKKLTHQNLNNKMNQDLIDIVLRDKESLKAYKALHDLHLPLKRKIVQEIALLIEIKFEKEGFLDFKVNHEIDSAGWLLTVSSAAMEKHAMFLCLNFESKNFSRLIIGFKNSSDKKPKDGDLLLKFRKIFKTGRQSDWWTAYMEFEGYTDWHFDVLSKIKFEGADEFLDELYNKVVSMIEIVENQYKVNDVIQVESGS